MVEKSYGRRQLWKSVISIVMLTVGGICFMFGCVAAMILMNKE